MLYKVFHGSKKMFTLLVRLPPLAQDIFESKAAKAESISGPALLCARIVLTHRLKHLPLTTVGSRTHIAIDLCSNLLQPFLCSLMSCWVFLFSFKNVSFHGNNYATDMYESNNVLRKHLQSVHKGQDVFVNIGS